MICSCFLCYLGWFRLPSSLTFLVSYCMKILNYCVWEWSKCTLLTLDATESIADLVYYTLLETMYHLL